MEIKIIIVNKRQVSDKVEGKLNSLTDVLKKTLFFFDAMTVDEITPYVHRYMLKDYSLEQVAEKVELCLQQHECFFCDEQNRWFLNLEGARENDKFYNMLLTKQKPLSLREIQNSSGKKKKKKNVAAEAALISDGRFIQLSNGYWGLAEWEVESSNYSLKQLVIKALKMYPGGLSTKQLHDVVRSWREVGEQEIQQILQKFPYFEQAGDGIWTYNSQSHLAYENILERFLSALERQRNRWHRDRGRWQNQVKTLQRQLEEVNNSYRETAAALAEKLEESEQHSQLLTQLAEKDLLLSLRKKEIYRYKEHLDKTEAKANNILRQCKIWVQRAREAEAEKQRLLENLEKTQASLESLFTKLQHYKEKDRENKAKIAELKDAHATRVAELQTEIVELKQKLEREMEKNNYGERRLREEINLLSNDLKDALEGNEELQKSLRMAQQELNRAREEYKKLESRLKNPVVRLAVKFCSFFDRKAGQVY